MQIPNLTFGYLVAFAGIYSILALIVVFLRTRHNVPYGDGGNELLLRAVRAHGNFAEWVPFCMLLVGALEVLGQPAAHVHALLATLLAARVLHPVALFSKLGSLPYYVGRIGGALSSWLVLTGSAVLLASRL